jgi:hypothetical protein
MEFRKIQHPKEKFNQISNIMKNSVRIFTTLVLATDLISFREPVTITGRVTDVQRNPLQGFSVSSK